MRNRFVSEETIVERERFISSIEPSDICNLASSYHDKTPCKLFKTTTHGSFNVCFFVEFDTLSAGEQKRDRWVVRIPIPKRVPWVDEKIETEVATMTYVSENTTIPIPNIHAWSYVKESPIGMAFIIMDYVEGKTLRDLHFPMGKAWDYSRVNRSRALTRVHDRLADLYIQLRGLEFPEIGALGMPTKHSPCIAVRHRPLTIEVLLQHAEGLDPSAIFPQGKTFKTSQDYMAALVKLAENLLNSKDPEITTGGRDGRKFVFGFRQFCRYVTKIWPERRGGPGDGPFVLMHGDLGIHDSNLLWDDHLNLVAVLDWEWSRTVPVQCFVPPVWLNGFQPDPIAYLSEFPILYQTEVKHLHHAIVKLAETCQPRPSASALVLDWQALLNWPHTVIVMALLYPDAIYDAYWKFLNYRLYGVDPMLQKSLEQHEANIDKLLDKYFVECEDAQDLLERKRSEEDRSETEWKEYLKKNGGGLRKCQCQGCLEERRNPFRLLFEAPRLMLSDSSTPSRTGTTTTDSHKSESAKSASASSATSATSAASGSAKS